ncbi:MAG: GxxExxY protein [Phycisphaeraceae bacterium]|nr:GxxExxY protein [Phycisphaeraceae bacterium]
MKEFTAESAENAEVSQSDEELTRRIIGAAISVHQALGSGLLESAYEACLAAEFHHLGIHYERQLPLPVHYRGVAVDCAYRLDFLVEQRVIVELKSVDRIEPIFQAQLLSYLRLADKPIGLLINFNVTRLVNGVKRLVHDYQSS